MPNSSNLPPRYLRTPVAACFVGLSGRTPEKHRTYGTGLCYRKIGGRVVYALADLQAWCEQGAKTSTSDPDLGTVVPAQLMRRPERLPRGVDRVREVRVNLSL